MSELGAVPLLPLPLLFLLPPLFLFLSFVFTLFIHLPFPQIYFVLLSLRKFLILYPLHFLGRAFFLNLSYSIRSQLRLQLSHPAAMFYFRFLTLPLLLERLPGNVLEALGLLFTC